jgi:hypothetical protein
MQEIVYLVVHDCDTVKAKSQNIDIRCPAINRWYIHNLDEFESPRIIMTHLPIDLLPDNLDKECKVEILLQTLYCSNFIKYSSF